MFEIFANMASPTAVSQAANTKITMGIGNIIMDCVFKGVLVARINKDSIIPSRKRRVDIRGNWNIRDPRKENVKARVMLNTAVIIFGNYDIII